MKKYVNWCVDETGAPIARATITVYQAGTLTKAALYDGAGAAQANPFTTEEDGSFAFYAKNGRYDIAREKTGYTFDEEDLADVLLYDPAEEPPAQAKGILIQDASGQRPSPGVADRFFLATDTGILFRDTGSAWDQVQDLPRRMPL